MLALSQSRQSAGLIYSASSATAYISTDNIIAGEKLSYFLHSRFGRIRTMHGILTNRSRMRLAYRSGSGLGRIGRTHDVTVGGHGVVTLKDLHHHRTRGHEIDQLAKEGAVAVNGIECFSLFASHLNASLRDNAQTGFFDHRVDGARQVAGGGIRLDDREGALDRHQIILLKIAGSCKGVELRGLIDRDLRVEQACAGGMNTP